MNTLKPCPFCGAMPEVADDGVCRCNNKSCSMAPYWYLPKYWNIRPIEDDLRKRIAELEALVNVSEGLYERIYEQAARIAELEAENDQLTADSTDERKDDKLPEREVCEACGGDGTLLLTDGYEGQVMATAKCIYCNGTGRVNKECEE